MTYRRLLILSLLFSSLLFSCRQHDGLPELPREADISQFNQTMMVPALECPIPAHKNIVYAPAFRYAWQEVTETLQADIRSKSHQSPILSLLNNTNDYRKSLDEGEYEAHGEVKGDLIEANASFRQLLPFTTPLQKAPAPILFDKQKVAAFGMHQYDYEVAIQCSVLYYADDDHFVLKLQPRDSQHEIILAKGIDTANKLSVALQQVNNWISQGNMRIQLRGDDLVSIPVISFHIKAHYKALEGVRFTTTDDRSYAIGEAWQRTGFAIDENGAVVESEATVPLTDTVAAPVIRPKRLVFDKPFYLLLRKTKRDHPYFVLKVENAELLKKEE